MYHEAWQEARTSWYAVVCLILVALVVAGVYLEVQAVRRGAWQPLPGQDGGGGGSGGGIVQMRSVGGTARPTEGTPLLHSPHTLE